MEDDLLVTSFSSKAMAKAATTPRKSRRAKRESLVWFATLSKQVSTPERNAAAAAAAAAPADASSTDNDENTSVTAVLSSSRSRRKRRSSLQPIDGNTSTTTTPAQSTGAGAGKRRKSADTPPPVFACAPAQKRGGQQDRPTLSMLPEGSAAPSSRLPVPKGVSVRSGRTLPRKAAFVQHATWSPRAGGRRRRPSLTDLINKASRSPTASPLLTMFRRSPPKRAMSLYDDAAGECDSATPSPKPAPTHDNLSSKDAIATTRTDASDGGDAAAAGAADSPQAAAAMAATPVAAPPATPAASMATPDLLVRQLSPESPLLLPGNSRTDNADSLAWLTDTKVLDQQPATGRLVDLTASAPLPAPQRTPPHPAAADELSELADVLTTAAETNTQAGNAVDDATAADGDHRNVDDDDGDDDDDIVISASLRKASALVQRRRMRVVQIDVAPSPVVVRRRLLPQPLAALVTPAPPPATAAACDTANVSVCAEPGDAPASCALVSPGPADTAVVPRPVSGAVSSPASVRVSQFAVRITSPPATPSAAASPVAVTSHLTASPSAAPPVAASPVAASPVAASPVAASPVAASPVAASPVADVSPVAASLVSMALPVSASPVATSPVATSPVAAAAVSQPTPSPITQHVKPSMPSSKEELSEFERRLELAIAAGDAAFQAKSRVLNTPDVSRPDERPRSEWSPIRRPRQLVGDDDAAYVCTKRVRGQSD